MTGNQTISENLNVTGVSTFAGVSTFSSTVLAQKSVQVAENLNVTGITTLGSIGISTGRITGPAITYIDPAAVGDNTGLLIIKGNLQVDGTQTTVNSTTMTVTDKNVELAKGAANDAAADGAGITVDSGDGDKTLNWVDSTDAWTSSEHFDLAAGKSYDIAGTEIIHSLRATLGGTLSVAGVTTVKQLEIGTLGQTLVGITTILDEDNMASNSAAALATQQSIKAYVDTQVTAQDLDFAGDSGTGAVDLDSQSLTLAGTSNEIETSASNQTVTIGLPNDVSITNLTLGGSVSAGSTTGVNGYYLKTTGIGVTWAAFPSSRTGLTTSATAGQTTFNFSYNVGFVDVFLNGVKLPSTEFTASNGSTIVLDDAAFANDTLEFISLNTLPVTSSGGAQNLTGLADVTISGTPVAGETLQHNGSVFVNDYTVTSTKTSTSQASIHSLAVATYRSVEYTVQITEGTKYHVTKILAIHDGTNVYFNEYGTLFTNSSLAKAY